MPLVCFGVVFAVMIVFELFAVEFSSIFLILIGGAIGIFAYALYKTDKTNKTDKTEKTDKKIRRPKASFDWQYSTIVI